MMKFLALLFMVSCSDPFQGKSPLQFKDRDQEKVNDALRRDEERRLFLIEKEERWKAIVTEAKSSFGMIQPIFAKKCISCHDASYKLPLYGRILPRINFVNKHQVKGLKALDFSEIFPLKAKGNPPQISLLKAIKQVVEARTMPIKSYLAFYPKRNIKDEDQLLINAWLDPLIEKIEAYEKKFNPAIDLASSAKQLLEQKCFRCHANGNDHGGFGKMEDVSSLIERGYINVKDSKTSDIYTQIEDGFMPPNPKAALTTEELSLLREWLKTLEKNRDQE